MSPNRLTPSILYPFISLHPFLLLISPVNLAIRRPTPWCSIMAVSLCPCRPYSPYLPEFIPFLLSLSERVITVSEFNPKRVTSALLHQQRPLNVKIMTVSWCCLSGLPLLLSQGESSWHCSTPFFFTVRLLPLPSLLCYCCLPTTWRS